ncbi:hypothetical protein RFI_14724 [Reticulomyxa filosa]|uniref:RING-type E3 ubiquitin transferase n=1 Tax=Reticulomyxa filosa TaxID=46433 RepID=X6N875_RETFI|nr:hypothetical protein RFI_14724 [Reticulomyxa filosa]|eukprot:ETO22475.1 hypothetical protein RFI_14724 [Reticulomyxa filosa]
MEMWSNIGNATSLEWISRMCENTKGWMTTSPIGMGYVVIVIDLFGLFVFDCMYCYWLRPHLVTQKKLRKHNISYLWCLIEHLSRLLAPFWKIIDSILQSIDWIFQLAVIPYLFGLCIEYAARSVRQINATDDCEHGMSLSLAFEKLAMIQEQSMKATATTMWNNISTNASTIEMGMGMGIEGNGFDKVPMKKLTSLYNPLELLWFFLFDNHKLPKDAFTYRETLRIIEMKLASHVLLWITGWLYVMITTKMFQQAQHLMRMEFNAHWMRLCHLPHPIPIRLNLLQVLKERLIGLRIHIPLLLFGFFIPCKLLRYCFPSVFPLLLFPKDIRNIPLTMTFCVYGFIAFAITKRLRLQQRCVHWAKLWLDTVAFGFNLRYLIVPGSDPPPEAIHFIVHQQRRRHLYHGLLIPPPPPPLPSPPPQPQPQPPLPLLLPLPNAPNEGVNNEPHGKKEIVADPLLQPQPQPLDDVVDAHAEICSSQLHADPLHIEPLFSDATSHIQHQGVDSLFTVEFACLFFGTWVGRVEKGSLLEEKKQENEENEEKAEKPEMKCTDNIEEKNNENATEEEMPADTEAKQAEKKTKKKKKRKTMDDIFLKQHPWENQHDLYLQLQNERVKLAKRCQLYTVGIDHIVLRIFFLILFAWLTYILIFFIAMLFPIVSGRFFMPYFQLIFRHHSDIAAYFIGTVTCVELPYEISRVFKNYHQGQLWKKIKKLLIRLFVLVFLPLTFGYGWMLMVFHFTHSMLETPLLPFAEMYCTGIYITTVYLLLQDQEKVQEIIRWIQGHMDIDLWRFWDEMAKHIVQLIIIHLSFPIALRYLLLSFHCLLLLVTLFQHIP